MTKSETRVVDAALSWFEYYGKNIKAASEAGSTIFSSYEKRLYKACQLLQMKRVKRT